MSFGETLKQIRLSMNYTQQELAEILGTTKQVISRYEQGQRDPKISIIQGWAKKLGLPEEVLTSEVVPKGFIEVYGNDRAAAIKAYEAARWSAMMDGTPEALAPDEAELLRLYRSADPVFQAEAVDMLRRHPRRKESAP